ncbi:MAG: hypothetical protein ACR2LL_09240 [Nitrosopumilus sp.]
MEDNNSNNDDSTKKIAKKGLESILSSSSLDIVDMILGRGTEKVVDSETLIKEVQTRVSQSMTVMSIPYYLMIKD